MKQYGGGMLYDWGVHLIDQILLIMDGKIESIHCRFDHLTNEEVDDGFQLNIGFDTGARAYIEVGTLNFIAMPRFYIQGDKGTAIIHDWRQNAKVTVCKAWHESDVIPVETAAGLTKTMAPRDSITTDEFEWERPESDVHDYYRNFSLAIDGKEDQIVTHEQMMRVIKVMEACFESVEKNQVIKVDL
jgi:predicted dehydrogenase